MPLPKDHKQIQPEPPDLLDSNELVEYLLDHPIDNTQLENVSISESITAPIHCRSLALYQSTIQGPPLTASILPSARFTDCAFNGADLSGATWVDARIVRTIFTCCKLTGFDARGAQLRDVIFKDCKLPDAFFQEASFTRVRFDNCQLPNLDLAGATLQSLAIQNSDACSLRLTETKIDHLDLRGSEIENIALGPINLKGILINSIQAPVLAISLGIQVKEIND